MGNSQSESSAKSIIQEIIVREEAQREVQEAFEYYEEKSKGLGFEYMRSLDAAIQLIKRNPDSYQKIHNEIRRVLLRKFPYAVFYLAKGTKVIIIAVFHQRRSETGWLKRS
jgi:toxin ParE1/3/4